ncbi:helix-turn-helix transcriptional regulator [uncultured Sulfitobacter sp.]|uniref:helix-turn-helix domain-containing protein n=1 Tax=uncultured Sulfitobacter sp. TaxID=191468 RepID=UPI0030F58439
MINEPIPTFESALKRHLEASDLDVTTLARKAGVSRDALYKVVYGKTKSPSLEIIIRVASAFGETVEEFMGLTPAQIRDDLLDEIGRLSAQERAVLHASLTALRPQQAADGAGKEPAQEPARLKDPE